MTQRPGVGARTRQGVLCGIGAGALWGLVFLAPELAPSFSSLQLAVGRYLAYGLLAAGLIVPRRRALLPMVDRRAWAELVALGLSGNIVYFVLLAYAVQLGGIAMTSLVIGFLPVVVTMIGSRDHGAVPLARLWPSLLLCLAGMGCIGWQTIANMMAGAAMLPVGQGVSLGPLLGLFCAMGAMASWTGFAIGNARCLGRLDGISAGDWNLLTGLATGALALALFPLVWVLGVGGHDGGQWAGFALVVVATAALASIVGNDLWNRMSRLLPLTMAGQMIVFETLFALLYGFLWAQRLPTPAEALAIPLMVAGVVMCVSVHHRGATRSPASI